MSDPFKTLGISPMSSSEEVKKRWRSVVSTLHPDRSTGNAVEFDIHRRAYKAALAQAEEREHECKRCRGNGKIKRVNGFASVELVCPDCNGDGHIQ